MIRKIKSNHGESISEVLVAGLVMSLGFIMITSMINASFNLIKNTEAKYAIEIADKNEFEQIDFNAAGTGLTAEMHIAKVSGCNAIDNVNITDYVNVYSKTVGEKTLRKYTR